MQVELLKLELIKEAKAQESLTSGRSERGGLDISESLCLLPKFDDKDPDTCCS